MGVPWTVQDLRGSSPEWVTGGTVVLLLAVKPRGMVSGSGEEKPTGKLCQAQDEDFLLGATKMPTVTQSLDKELWEVRF